MSLYDNHDDSTVTHATHNNKTTLEARAGPPIEGPAATAGGRHIAEPVLQQRDPGKTPGITLESEMPSGTQGHDR